MCIADPEGRSTQGGIKTNRILTVFFVISIALATVPQVMGSNHKDEKNNPPEKMTIHYRTSYSFEVNGIIEYTRISHPLPGCININYKNIQQPSDPDYSVQPDIIRGSYDHDHHLAIFEQRDYSRSYSMSIEQRVVLNSYTWPIDRENSGELRDIYSFGEYLGDEWAVIDPTGKMMDEDGDGEPDHYHYNPSNPRVKALAQQLTVDEKTVYGKVERIYEWMRENIAIPTHIQSERDDETYGTWPKYPEATMDDGYGFNDDQSLLMASLCRASGIPAWLELGLYYDPSDEFLYTNAWLNVVIPGRSMTDTLQEVVSIDPIFGDFLFRAPYAVTDWVDNGEYILNEDMTEVYNLHYYYSYLMIRRKYTSELNAHIDYEVLEVRFYSGEGSKRSILSYEVILISVIAFLSIPVTITILWFLLRYLTRIKDRKG